MSIDTKYKVLRHVPDELIFAEGEEAAFRITSLD